jgi:hypothetical protein
MFLLGLGTALVWTWYSRNLIRLQKYKGNRYPFEYWRRLRWIAVVCLIRPKNNNFSPEKEKKKRQKRREKGYAIPQQ